MVEQAQRKSGGGRLRQKLFFVMVILLGAAFLPISTVFAVGMLPTFAAFLSDPSRDKTRSFTIGLLNFVTCFPFAMDVALGDMTMTGAIDVVTQAMNVIVMFTGAAAGYFLDWTMAGISNVIMTSRARQRLDAIEKRQADLVRRWGQEVSGTIPVDIDGFPFKSSEDDL